MNPEKGQVYRTAAGEVTVTNPVHRQILAELAHGERQLQDLVEVTGKTKPALSGVYMKELVREGLVVERPHSQDSRRKMFRLNAVPVTPGVQRAAAVVGGNGAGAERFSLAAAFRTIAAAPRDVPDEMLRAQVHALGLMVARSFPTDSAGSFATAFSRFVEDEGLARHLQLDFEVPSFRCVPGSGVLGVVKTDRLGFMLAVLAEAVAEANGLKGVRLESVGDGEAFKIRPR